MSSKSRVCFSFWLCGLAFCAWQGCAMDLKPQETTPTDAAPSDTPNGPPETRVVQGQKVSTKELGEGVTQVTVNSSDEKNWIYFSFSSNREANPTNPQDSSDWDIAFQRFKIKSNGGVSGSGNVSAAHLDDKPFDSIQVAPKDGFVMDQEDGPDENTDPDYAFLVNMGWYVYNFQDHTLTPRKRVYIVKDIEGQYIKVELTAYYDANGNSGFPTFRWAKINPPE